MANNVKILSKEELKSFLAKRTPIDKAIMNEILQKLRLAFETKQSPVNMVISMPIEKGDAIPGFVNMMPDHKTRYRLTYQNKENLRYELEIDQK